MQYHNPYISSHYAQAYAQYAQYPSLPAPQTPRYVPPPRPSYSQMSSWYQPGGYRCTYKGCTFTGSEKTVEMHMMDRHLIYPPGWDKIKSPSGWDADPSLKGKRIPIQGTTIVLDSPEAWEAWIAERRRRWPSTTRVQDKQKRLDEAVARGQIVSGDPDFHQRKKRRIDASNASSHSLQHRQNEHSARPPLRTFHPLPKKPTTSPVSDNDSDGPPETLSTKPLFTIMPAVQEDTQRNVPRPKTRSAPTSQPKPRTQPPRPLVNPFASRPPLLRTLLLPEIRVTLSNLSQAIRFIVENDFLDNVELKPGQAENKMIEEVTPEGALKLPSTIKPANI